MTSNESPVVTGVAKCQGSTLGLALCYSGGPAALAVRLDWTHESQSLTPEPSTFLHRSILPSTATHSRSPCRHLQVVRGRLSFIILSKSGTALARVDWVSVKHQDLIEFVLKRVLLGSIAYSEATVEKQGGRRGRPSG